MKIWKFKVLVLVLVLAKLVVSKLFQNACHSGAGCNWQIVVRFVVTVLTTITFFCTKTLFLKNLKIYQGQVQAYVQAELYQLIKNIILSSSNNEKNSKKFKTNTCPKSRKVLNQCLRNHDATK